MTFSSRLEEFREAQGWTQEQMAAAMGVSLRTYSRYAGGDGAPKVAHLERLAELGADVSWMLAGPNRPSQRPPDETGPSLVVERLSFAASAGSGTLVLQETGQTVPVRPELLKRLNLQPHQARLLDADGDSMAPTIRHGDPLLVDVSAEARARVVDNAIYVFTIGDEAFVKRLRRDPGRFVMISDNRENFPERDVPPGDPFRIIGRVRWVEREL